MFEKLGLADSHFGSTLRYVGASGSPAGKAHGACSTALLRNAVRRFRRGRDGSRSPSRPLLLSCLKLEPGIPTEWGVVVHRAFGLGAPQAVLACGFF